MKKGIFSIFLFLAVTVSGQTKKLENLLSDLKYAKEDTNKVSLLLAIEKKYFSIDLDSALYYNSICEKLISKINASDYKHRCLHEYVRIYHALHDYRNALNYCLLSIKVAEQQKNKFHAAISYRALFNLYHNLNMNDSAVKYATYSLKLTTEINDTSNVAANYANLCWLYMDLYQYEKAQEYGILGVEAGKRYADTIGMLIATNNLALCYMRTNKYQKAEELFKKQYETGLLVNRPRSIRNALTNLGNIYYDIGNTDGLKAVTKQLNDYNSEYDDLDAENRCLQNIQNAYNYMYQKKFDAAELELKAALKIAETDSLTERLHDIYIVYANLKFAQHDFVSGVYFGNKWDSLTLAKHEKEVAEFTADLETKYETEKKSEKIRTQASQLKQQSLINYLLAAAGLSVLLIFLLSYRTYRQKQKLQQQRIGDLETQQQLTATEAVLKGEEQERTRIAKDLHDGLGGMLSGIKYSFSTMKGNLVMTPDNAQAFERSMDMLDSSIKEMRRVAHNMMPEALVKFGLDTALKDFCNDISQSGALQVSYQSFGLVQEQMDQTISITIYRIVQELINNTMKHAGATSAVVQITKSDHNLSVTVEDNGKGFDTAVLEVKKGIGWDNIKNRVEFLKGTLDVQSEKDKGTSVLIELNV